MNQELPSAEAVETKPVPEIFDLEKHLAEQRKKRLRLGIVAAVLLACALSCVFLGFGGLRGFQSLSRDKVEVEILLDQLMRDMVSQDFEAAYDRFSTRAKRQVPFSEIENFGSGANYALFDGYQRLEIATINIGPSFNTNQNVPQGTLARVQGIVYYDNGFQGQFSSVLELEEDEWKVSNFNVTVSPEKLDQYLKDQN